MPAACNPVPILPELPQGVLASVCMTDQARARVSVSRGLPGAQAMLEQAGVSVFLNELSCTVVFERPREERFVRKWQAGL